MSATTMIGMLNTQLGHSPKGLSTDVLTERNTLILKLIKVLETHDADELLILRDESRSQQGKLEALKKLGTEQTAPSLKFMKSVIDALQTKDQNYRKRFFTVDSGITNIVEKMGVMSYLWNRFDVLDGPQCSTRFLRAAEVDEVVVLSALLTNPGGVLVDADVQRRALTDRAQRLYPQQYENFTQNQIVLELLTMIRDWFGRWLNQEIGVPVEVVRTNLGDNAATRLDVQTRSGLPQPNTPPELAAALQ